MKMRSNWFRMVGSWFGLLGTMLIAFLTANFSSDMALAQSPREAIRILSEQKSIVEKQASILVDLFDKKEINHQEYWQGRSLYDQAQAAFNGWIDQLKSDLHAGVEVGASQRYNDALSKAADKMDDFIAYVDEKFLGHPRGVFGTRAKSVFEVIRDAGRDIWKAAAGEGAHQNQREIALVLEQSKLKSFTEIEVQL